MATLKKTREKLISLKFVGMEDVVPVTVRSGMKLRDVLVKALEHFEVGFLPHDYPLGKKEKLFRIVQEGETLFVSRRADDVSYQPHESRPSPWLWRGC